MNCAGIISEFDPFHTGHKHLIDSIRSQTQLDAVVCVMSGDFVQRGMPAMWDKFARAEAAVEGGADLVLELPAVYAVSGAGQFARGGVRVLKGLGCVTHIGFGSECADGVKLLEAAKVLSDEPGNFSQALKDALALGLSYPAAYSRAAQTIGLDEKLFKGANDILALEYLKQNCIQEAGFKPVAVRRLGAKHNSLFTEDGFASASYLRQLAGDLSNEETPEPAVMDMLSKYILPGALETIRRIPHLDGYAENRYFRIIQYKLMGAKPEELAGVAEMSEGFENVLKKEAYEASSLDGLIQASKIKRFTYAKISRILAQLYLGITKDMVRECDDRELAYAKVLAFNARGAQVLAEAAEKGTIPVLSNTNKDRKKYPEVKPLLDADIRASELYGILMGYSPKEFSDLSCIPRPCNV